MTIQPTTSAPLKAASQAPPPARTQLERLQDFYDKRQHELQADEQVAQAQELKAAKGQKWAIAGAGAMIAGMAGSAASTLVSSALRSGVLGTGISLWAVGVAAFAPGLWVRDSAAMKADFARLEAGALSESQQHLADEIQKLKEQPKPSA